MNTLYKKGATLSKCGKYRYMLWRIWDEEKPLVFWLLHNPSTADANADDPTIRRLISFAKSWGYGGLYVGNLTPFRATNPHEVQPIDDYIAKKNSIMIQVMAKLCECHILGTGNLADAKALDLYLDIIHGWKCLKLNKSGFPAHPLYLQRNLLPKLYKQEGGEG